MVGKERGFFELGFGGMKGVTDAETERRLKKEELKSCYRHLDYYILRVRIVQKGKL